LNFFYANFDLKILKNNIYLKISFCKIPCCLSKLEN